MISCVCACVTQGLRYCTPRQTNLPTFIVCVRAWLRACGIVLRDVLTRLNHRSRMGAGKVVLGGVESVVERLHPERNLNNKNSINICSLGLHPNCRFLSV